ncbi:MAG TPA: hypothetical protein VMU49_02330 [Candidatus Acidoferrales bacterium]|nr:hypothetical protein [Candidatus Acidoferrales bacterium]
MMLPDERRSRLRRLDDVLEALEQLNLHEIVSLPEEIAVRLVEVGLPDPYDHPIPILIEQVWGLQQPLLIAIPVERRRRRRRTDSTQPFFAQPG